MGQRHQIFVKIANPVKHMYLQPKEKAELEKILGTDDTTILSFHNQWLYGRTALQQALNLLKFGKQFKLETKTDIKSWEGHNCPFAPNGYRGAFGSLDKITTAIAFVHSFRATATSSIEAGFGGTFFLEDNELREDCSGGDNNDGITIIDLIENKYCFMNIFEQDTVDEYRAMSLPKLQPVDAKAYVTAYYGETIETINPYFLGDHDRSKITKTVEQQQKIVDSQIRENKKAVKGFEKFEVLTLDEVQAMFKKMKFKKPRKTAKKVA